MLMFRELNAITREPDSGEILSNFDDRQTSKDRLTSYLNSDGYTLHHIAATRGYMSRRATHLIAEPYNGRFGEGYIIAIPRYDTTNYYYIEYYIKKED